MGINWLNLLKFEFIKFIQKSAEKRKKTSKKGQEMPSFSSYRKCNYLKISGLRFFYPISTQSL